MSEFGREAQAAITVQIKAEMAAKDWNQLDLATATGMATSTLSRYLSGSRDFPFPILAEISLALGLPLTELTTRAQRRQEGAAKRLQTQPG